MIIGLNLRKSGKSVDDGGFKAFDSQPADIVEKYRKHDCCVKPWIIREILGKHSLLSADYADY